MKNSLRVGVALSTVVLLASSCAGDDDGNGDGGVTSGQKNIKVMYQRTEGIQAVHAMFATAKEQFQKDNPGVTIELQPIEAAEEDYATQLALQQQSPDTAPDVVYQDTFRVRSDAAAGYLLPLDDRLAGWSDWSKFVEAAKKAGSDGQKTYAVPLGTDTRGIWYHTGVFQKAGINVPWQPKTWKDVLDAAAKIKASQPGVIPFHMYAGKPGGEGTVMQSFLPLLYGSGDGKGLYDDTQGKWIVGSTGFKDALTFLQTLYKDGYSVPASEALDANLWQSIFDKRFPDAKLGGVVEGSYGGSFWKKDGPYPWPEYTKHIKVAGFPTQNGQGTGTVSMSGGWTVAIGANTAHPDEAFKFLTYVVNFENNRKFVIDSSQIAVRTDVAQDPEYLKSDPNVKFFTDMVANTHYRPADANYPRISAAIQEATEKVVTGKATPEQAAQAFDQAVIGVVGKDKVVQGQ